MVALEMVRHAPVRFLIDYHTGFERMKHDRWLNIIASHPSAVTA